jgi:hypothetical protein
VISIASGTLIELLRNNNGSRIREATVDAIVLVDQDHQAWKPTLELAEGTRPPQSTFQERGEAANNEKNTNVK